MMKLRGFSVSKRYPGGGQTDSAGRFIFHSSGWEREKGDPMATLSTSVLRQNKGPVIGSGHLTGARKPGSWAWFLCPTLTLVCESVSAYSASAVCYLDELLSPPD